jgi:hypothetical protein
MDSSTSPLEDIDTVPEEQRNRQFNEWAETLRAWDARTEAATGEPIVKRRIDFTRAGAFDFLNDGVEDASQRITVELLGPVTEQADGHTALRFLRNPPDDANLMLGDRAEPDSGSYSASHTIINGHSINFRLRFGNVNLMFTGDMNQQSMQQLREAKPDSKLRSEILKCPLAIPCPAGPVTQTLSWVAKQHVVPISSSVNRPSPLSRAISACTVSLDSTSTPRWLMVPPVPGFWISTSLSGGSATAKLA